MIALTRRSAPPDVLDTLLIVTFLIGIYLGYSPRITAGVPIPAAPAGFAGAVLLLRHYRNIEQRQIVTLIVVITLYLFSILCVSDSSYLGERTKGFLQLSYSLAVGYGAWLTFVQFDRDRLSRIFLYFVLAILIGCALENYTGFGAVSDFVRGRLFDTNLYEATLRDQTLYGGRRPKLFTSEPSHVAFGFTVFAFFWYVISRSANKTIVYVAILGAGLFLIRSPTVVLGFILIAPYQLLVAGRAYFGRVRGADAAAISLIGLSLAALGAWVLVSGHLFEERMNRISTGDDASYFFRIVGPAAVAWDTLKRRPIAGAGLTGEEVIAGRVYQIYVTAPNFSPEWRVDRISEVITNYFWHHWIYLGAAWGLAILIAFGGFLRSLRTPSIAFCGIVWAVMGQAAGAYVSPKCWAVLFLAAAMSLVHRREPVAAPAGRSFGITRHPSGQPAPAPATIERTR